MLHIIGQVSQEYELYHDFMFGQLKNFFDHLLSNQQFKEWIVIFLLIYFVCFIVDGMIGEIAVYKHYREYYKK